MGPSVLPMHCSLWGDTDTKQNCEWPYPVCGLLGSLSKSSVPTCCKSDALSINLSGANNTRKYNMQMKVKIS